MSEQEIIQQIQSGNTKYYQLLYEKYAGYGYAIIKNYVQNQELIKDVLQDTFVAVFQSMHNYQAEKGQFKHWFSRICVRTCIHQLRQRHTMFIVHKADPYEDTNTDQLSYEIQTSNLPLEELLKEMPDGYRTIFLLHEIDGYSHFEISNLLEIKIDTSRSQLSRAIQWLRKKYADPNGSLKQHLS